MSFLKKIGNILSKENFLSKELEFESKFNEKDIELIPNKSILEDENVKDLIAMHNIEIVDNKIIVSYECIYDLYYDDNENKVYTYKIFNLPDMFNGFISIENSEYLASDNVAYNFYFENSEGRYYVYKYNILKNNSKPEYKVMSKDLFNLTKNLLEYNRDKEKRSDVSRQFEKLKEIKYFSNKLDIVLNQRLREEPTPVVVDDIKIDFNDDGETLEIFPVLSEDENINDDLLSRIDSYNDIKGIYSTVIDNQKVRFVVKHKDTLKKIIKNRVNRGEDRLNILTGKSEIFEDENIDISMFGPRVTGIGYLSYKNSTLNVKTSDLNWLENNVEFPHIHGTNLDGNFENIKLTPDDKLKLQLKLVDMENNNKNIDEVEFDSDKGNKIKLIMNKDDIKKEIQNINSRIKTPQDISKINTLENILDICDNYKEDKYIPYNGMYLYKGSSNIKEEIKDRINNIRENNKDKKNEENKRTLLIAENLDDNEYVEKNTVNNNIFNKAELPKGIKKGINLFEYQNNCLAKLQGLYLDSKVNGFLLCDDMGLGKTLQLLAFLGWLKDRGELKTSLVVAPTSLLNNWDSEENGEIQKFFIENLFNTEKVRGKVTSKDLERLKEKDIVFITYESLRLNNVILGKINWKVMICDEAQKIKNAKTMMTIAAKAQNANFKIVCTATPIENTIEDLWTLTDYSKPGLLGSLKEFKNTYINKYKNATNKELEELNDNLYSRIEDFYIRREKDILPKGLPKKFIKIYKNKPTSVEIDYIENIKETEEYALSAIQKMLIACGHVDALNNNDIVINIENIIKKSSKLTNLKYILDDIKIKNEKVIIFTRIRKIQQIIFKAVKLWFGFESSIVNGELTNLDKRSKIINDFKSSKGFNVIILSPEVAGFGITITEANHVIHYTRLWNPAKEDQATDRVYRIGQIKDVYVHYPIITFGDEEVLEYDNMQDYVNDNMTLKSEALSPEEKLNILLARKKDMLINFFLAAGNGEIRSEEFLSLDNNSLKKIYITMETINKNIISQHEFEGLIAVLYERFGYKSYLKSKSNNNGVNLICKKEDEILFIQCEKSFNLISEYKVNDLLYTMNKYNNYIKEIKTKGVLVILGNRGEFTNKSIDIVDRNRLSSLLEKYKIYKDEIDNIENNRYSFEQMIKIL